MWRQQFGVTTQCGFTIRRHHPMRRQETIRRHDPIRRQGTIRRQTIMWRHTIRRRLKRYGFIGIRIRRQVVCHTPSGGRPPCIYIYIFIIVYRPPRLRGNACCKKRLPSDSIYSLAATQLVSASYSSVGKLARKGLFACSWELSENSGKP